MTIATIGMIEVALSRFFSLTTDRTLEPSVPTFSMCVYVSYIRMLEPSVPTFSMYVYVSYIRMLEPSVPTFVCVVC